MVLYGGPDSDKARSQQKKADEIVATANQKINQAQSLTPEGQIKKIIKEELAKKQQDNIVATDPPSPLKQVGQELAEQAIDAVVEEAVTSESAEKPTEPYNRKKHYGKTPTQSDRTAIGAGQDEVADHGPPLVKRYYEGDPARGEKPGWQLTEDERRASAGDRSRMQPQPKSESNKQGGEMSRYSREKKKEHGL